MLIQILNGANPRSSVLRNNFDFLAGGAGIKTGSTLAACQAAAQAAPTQAFSCIPTDLPAWLLYTGSAAAGPDGNGWVTVVSWETIS